MNIIPQRVSLSITFMICDYFRLSQSTFNHSKAIFDFVHKDDVLVVTKVMQTTLQQPGLTLPEMEFRIRHHNDSWRTVAATITNLIGDATIGGILVNCHDITGRKRAEESVRKSEEQFRLTFELAPTGIYITTIKGQFLEVNQTFCNVLGYTSEELIGLTFSDVTYVDDVNTNLDLFQQVLAGKILMQIVQQKHANML